MCLHAIICQEESIPDEDGPECGWKVFIEDEPPGGAAELFGPYHAQPRLVESRVVSVESDPPEYCQTVYPPACCYRAGFHIFQHFSDAAAYSKGVPRRYIGDTRYRVVVRQVSYWGDVVRGRIRYDSVVVAYNMLVHPVTAGKENALWSYQGDIARSRVRHFTP